MSILNDEPYVMERVSGVIFVQNKTRGRSNTADLSDQYVGLTYYKTNFYLSIRKISDLNKNLFTVKISGQDIGYLHQKTISLSLHTHDDKEIIILKIANNDKRGADKDLIFTYVK